MCNCVALQVTNRDMIHDIVKFLINIYIKFVFLLFIVKVEIFVQIEL